MFTNADIGRAVPLEFSNGRVRAICGVSLGGESIGSFFLDEEFIIDTGALCCIFPSRIWRPWEHSIRFIDSDTDLQIALDALGLKQSFARGLRKIRGFSGSEFDCKIGIVNLHPVGEDGRRIDLVDCLAKFAVDDLEDREVQDEDGVKRKIVDIPNPIIGLSGIRGAGLCVNLEDFQDPSIHVIGRSRVGA